MVVLIISIYLFLVFIFLLFAKGRQHSKRFLKNKYLRVSGLVLTNKKLFCSSHSTSFMLYKNMLSSLFIFKNVKWGEQCMQNLTNAGINSSLPIVKYEVYESNINFYKLYGFLKAIKNLDKKQVSFNLFVFVNQNKNIKNVEKLIKSFSLKNVFVRVYNCCEINYKLLASINTLNIYDTKKLNSNLNNNLDSNLNNNLKNNLNKNLNINLTNNFNNNVNKSLTIKKHKERRFLVNNLLSFNPNFLNLQEDFFVLYNNVPVGFDFAKYNNFVLSKKGNVNNINIVVKKTYNCENKLVIYNLSVSNLNSTMQTIILGCGKVFNKITTKNAIYGITNDMLRTKISNLLTGDSFCFYGNFENRTLQKDGFFCTKKINLKPNETYEIYFAVSQNFVDEKLNKLPQLIMQFNNAIGYFKSLNMPKVFCEDKTLNYLVNQFLIDKIINSKLQEPFKINADFNNLINLKFNPKYINKLLINKNLNSIFLLKKDYFLTYFNLLYFYFGMWQDKQGVSLNQDKSLFKNNASILLRFNKKVFTITLKNNNLKNEIGLNNIRYTNLNYLNFNENNLKPTIDLLF